MGAYDNLSNAQQASVRAPLPYNTDTRTSVGASTAWTKPQGAGISGQTPGSFIKFGDSSSTTALPKSDKGAGRNAE